MSGDHLTIRNSERVCFDYTDFLSASCKKHWSFVDAIYGVMPLFGMVTRTKAEAIDQNSRLKSLALQVLSTQVSDETNIIRLIELAQQQGFDGLDIQLPYALDDAQLTSIVRGCGLRVFLSQENEHLKVQLAG
ncbi:hypothetical protein [Enterobacillus tribolii]|uniref:Uncharacterized protein n=1 Tax=Enterobacillus tribolii TaxID=1487935 RepID=A0A370R454_9GAMM|nr:hypothetical protein [Enterobacillus tribolii]MBW7983157.1 hypothetical protein [Enterobacillus tribolii]RDK97212.1 hypothetical protein C8D90_101657 [Enterobacillus tribolii]